MRTETPAAKSTAQPDHWTARILPGLLILLVTGLAVSFFCHQVGNNDIWWHLKAGELIMQDGAVPHADPFSYALEGKAWTDFEWLYQVVVYGASRVGGWKTLTLLHAFAAAGALVLAGMSAKGTVVARAVAMFIAVLGYYVYPWLRPQVFTLLFLGLYLYVLRPGAPPGWGKCVGILLVQAIWVNMHGGYAFGIVVLVLYAISMWVERRFPAARRATVLAVAAILVTVINPYGWHLLVHGFREMGAVYAKRYIAEWASPLALGGTLEQRVFYLLTLLVVLTTVVRGRIDTPFSALVSGAFLVLAFRSTRFTPVFALASVPLLTENLADLQGRLPARARAWSGRVAVIVLMLLCVFGIRGAGTGTLYALTGRDIHPGWGPDRARLPVEAAEFIAANDLPDALYSPYASGGYLIGRFYPDRQVLQDGRNALYGDELLLRFRGVLEDPARFPALRRDYGFNTLLIPHGWGLYHDLLRVTLRNPAWKLVHADLFACVFVRADHPVARTLSHIDLSAERPPADFVWPSPAEFSSRSAFTELFAHGFDAEKALIVNKYNLYLVARNEPMQAYILARFLQEVPAYHFRYSQALDHYERLYPRNANR
jgi:hypothetical protein